MYLDQNFFIVIVLLFSYSNVAERRKIAEIEK